MNGMAGILRSKWPVVLQAVTVTHISFLLWTETSKPRFPIWSRINRYLCLCCSFFGTPISQTAPFSNICLSFFKKKQTAPWTMSVTESQIQDCCSGLQKLRCLRSWLPSSYSSTVIIAPGQTFLLHRQACSAGQFTFAVSDMPGLSLDWVGLF